MTTQTYTPQEWLKAFGLISPIGLKDEDDYFVRGIDQGLWIQNHITQTNSTSEFSSITISTDTLVNHLLNALEPLLCEGIEFKFAKADFGEVYFGHGIKGLTPKLFKLAQPALAKLINQDTYTKTGNGWGRG